MTDSSFTLERLADLEKEARGWLLLKAICQVARIERPVPESARRITIERRHRTARAPRAEAKTGHARDHRPEL